MFSLHLVNHLETLNKQMKMQCKTKNTWFYFPRFWINKYYKSSNSEKQFSAQRHENICIISALHTPTLNQFYICIYIYIYIQCWAVTSYCNLVTVIILLFAVTSSVTVTNSKYSRMQSGRLGRGDTFGRGDTCRSAHPQFHWFITRQILLV